MKFYLTPHEPGPFSFELPIYVDDGGLRVVQVKISGEAVADDASSQASSAGTQH
jgi:hypothetical protein